MLNVAIPLDLHYALLTDGKVVSMHPTKCQPLQRCSIDGSSESEYLYRLGELVLSVLVGVFNSLNARLPCLFALFLSKSSLVKEFFEMSVALELMVVATCLVLDCGSKMGISYQRLHQVIHDIAKYPPTTGYCKRLLEKKFRKAAC